MAVIIPPTAFTFSNEQSDKSFHFTLSAFVIIVLSFTLLLALSGSLIASVLLSGWLVGPLKSLEKATRVVDLGDFRPGLDAAKKKNIVSPLVKCKINKNEVRQLAKLIGLPNWDKPAQPCLSSRVPYGIRISMDSLKRIERSENFLSDLGFLNFRVRIHGDLAKIEVSEDDFVKFSNHQLRQTIIKNFKKFGFKFVSLDLMFFSSGNLSRAQINE